MSLLKPEVKSRLRPYLEKGKTLLELFVGEDSFDPGDSRVKDSLEFFYALLGTEVHALGANPFEAEHIVYHQAIIPPYPDIADVFDYILINEQEQFWNEIGLQDGRRSDCPVQTVRFIDDHLKDDGKLLITDTSEDVARIIYAHMSTVGRYSFSYEHDVALISKEH